MEQDDIQKLEKLYFKEPYALYELQYNHFNDCLERIIPGILKDNPNKFYESNVGNKIYSYSFKFDDISLKPPVMPNKEEYMFPEDARKGNLTYSARIEATITQVQEIFDINTQETETKIIGDIEKEHPIASIPIMIKSNYCNTNLKKDINNTECQFDPGCYFIVKGNEKVVIGMERMCDNKLLVFSKKDVNFDDGYQLFATVNSKKKNFTEMIQTVNIRLKKDNSIIIETPHFAEIPVVVMLRALGMESDKDIVDYICNDPNNINMQNLIRVSLNDIKMAGYNDEKGQQIKIRNNKDAILSLMTKIKKFKKVGDSNQEIQDEQKRVYIMRLLENDVLPHLGTDLFKKALYICQAINKVLNVHLKVTEPDDRDSYENKRVDMPGTLMAQLFKQYYKKMLNEINKFFEKKYNGDDENPINVINQIKPNIIEQGLVQGLSTGVWGIQKARKGVSQALQRYSYLQTISYFRRIVTPSVDSSTQKVVSIRHARNNQYGFLDAVETPEGAKIGLQKHLSLMADITISMGLQVNIIIDLIQDKIVDLINVHPYEYNKYAKIIINGDWIGFSENPLELVELLREKRANNYINRHVSIVADIYNFVKEIRIYTDGGRMIRPLLAVKDNKLKLTREMLNDIDLSGLDKQKINKWTSFILKYQGVIDYIDVEESELCMVAMFLRDLNKNRKKMSEIVKEPNASGDPINRYNDTVYVKYTHMEFHPSMMLGTSSANIPFPEHNQAPRNIYNFSQSKQGKGIFATNERHRMDISFRLAAPQYPLVTTRGSEYTRVRDMPNGENVIVAIECRTGYNQEDSLIFNQAAIDRGLFRSYIYKKWLDEIKKNPSTSQDDKFTKPDPSKVTGIRKANYDKLNNLGHLELETEVKNGDVVIGKISPLDPGTENQNKIYKDNSQIYKSNVTGYVDKVSTGMFNADGYEMYSTHIRSERIPCIGDKFASRHGQKGTVGLILSAADMPFTKDGIQPDLIMNPNAVPSRMTVAQLLECVLGKVSALRGHFSDATAFTEYDIREACEILKEHGFEEHGFEDLYCGMTGKKIRSQIFIGPTYYMRLKHLVHEKIHARARGPRQVLTRQPPEGEDHKWSRLSQYKILASPQCVGYTSKLRESLKVS
tara:strand:+ start:113 stop:3469 length:3357 start_codon:yes stop_codon:yes gene_type:complete